MTRLTNAAARAIIAVKLALFDGGQMKFYTGAAPANTEDAPTGTLVGTLTFADPAFTLNAADDGVDVVATANPVTRDDGADTGATIGYYRLLDSGGTAFDQGSVGGIGSGADIEMRDPTVATGEPLEIEDWVITKALNGG
jgi:hypothetical protein